VQCRTTPIDVVDAVGVFLDEGTRRMLARLKCLLKFGDSQLVEFESGWWCQSRRGPGHCQHTCCRACVQKVSTLHQRRPLIVLVDYGLTLKEVKNRLVDTASGSSFGVPMTI